MKVFPASAAFIYILIAGFAFKIIAAHLFHGDEFFQMAVDRGPAYGGLSLLKVVCDAPGGNMAASQGSEVPEYLFPLPGLITGGPFHGISISFPRFAVNRPV
jgi:hypothetical protein